MPVTSDKAIGRAPEELTLDERMHLTGKHIALELYSPATTPFRRIEAIGDSMAECIRMLQARGLDPENFEYDRLYPPY